MNNQRKGIRHWVGLLLGTALLIASGCGAGPTGEAVEVDATLAGQRVADSDRGNPIVLENADVADIELTITNVTDEPVTIGHVRLTGQVIDLTFLSYDTGVEVPLGPGETTQFGFPFDFFDLDGQANGLLRARVGVYDTEREVLGSQDLIVDVKGGGFSTMGLFTLLLLVITVASLAWNLLRLATRKLPPNRFVRALRFMATGVAAGLTISTACSLLGIWPLPTVTWLLITIVGGIIGFVLGYLTPGADGYDEEEVLDLLDEREEAEQLERAKARQAEADKRKEAVAASTRATVRESDTGS